MDGENLVKSLNKNGKNLQVDVQVITLKDNLFHPYFSLISISKDNLYPIGVAKMEAPYTPYISDYWIKYSDVVIISFNMMNLEQQNTNSLNFLESNNIKQRINNDEYNYSMICKVSRFKQEGNKFIIYYEDLGWKFLQKVPKEFRATYIAGQYLDDAFQAICEFLGVDFAYSIEDLHEYTFAADGYSIEKDGKTIEDVPSILREWGPDKEEIEDELDDPLNENQGLIDFKKQEEENNKQNNNSSTNKNNNNSINNDTSLNEDTENDEESEDKKNEENLKEKINKYQEEFDQKVLDLFIGNTYYESDLITPLMNYNAITITPRVTDTNTDTPTISSAGNDSDDLNEGSSGQESSSSNSVSSTNGGVSGVYGKTAAGSYYLTNEAINKMDIWEARRRYEDGQKRNIYTRATMYKLGIRMYGFTV